jgi:YidC/Oxa1 family membrane protein insertase
MANLRPILFVLLALLGYTIWVEWHKDYGAPPVATNTPAQKAGDIPAAAEAKDGSAAPAPVPSRDNAGKETGDLPPAPTAPEKNGPGVETKTVSAAARELLEVKTDVLDVAIDPVGGTVVSARLLKYPVDLDAPNVKVDLLSAGGPDMFIAQSGLLSQEPAPNHTSTYQIDKMHYELAPGADEVRVPLTWVDDSGIHVTKTFIFKRGRYDIDVRHTVDNGSGRDWSGSRYEQLQRMVAAKKKDGGFTNPGRYSFFGIGFYSPADKFVKVKFDDVASDPFKGSFAGGWLAMIQHYFFAAWIPPADETDSYSTQVYSPEGKPHYIARAISPRIEVPAGTVGTFSSRLFVGPKLQNRLEDIAPGLRYTVNYGIFTVFAKPLFWLLSHIHSFVGNWGWAIVLLTVLIKLLFFKLTEAQYRSMARMRKLQPRIEQIKERYGDDRQRMSQAMMELYKTEKVNPLGGCLPIVIQIPIFIALYWVLLESVELRQAPFILWINNLSVRDPYFILPVLNAAFMIMTQRLTPTAGMDPLQAKIMQFMPIGFSFMFAFFPAGLVLYWATNAGLSLAQQWYITRKINASS